MWSLTHIYLQLFQEPTTSEEVNKLKDKVKKLEDELQSKRQEIEQMIAELDQAKEELTATKNATDMHNAQQQSVSDKF